VKANRGGKGKGILFPNEEEGNFPRKGSNGGRGFCGLRKAGGSVRSPRRVHGLSIGQKKGGAQASRGMGPLKELYDLSRE